MLVEDVRPSRYRHALAAASEIIGDGLRATIFSTRDEADSKLNTSIY
jgi:hypothetical protein